MWNFLEIAAPEQTENPAKLCRPSLFVEVRRLGSPGTLQAEISSVATQDAEYDEPDTQVPRGVPEALPQQARDPGKKHCPGRFLWRLGHPVVLPGNNVARPFTSEPRTPRSKVVR